MRALDKGMTKASGNMTFPVLPEGKHRRGTYRSMHTGLSCGGGSLVSPTHSVVQLETRMKQQSPGELKIWGEDNRRNVELLRRSENMIILAKYINCECL